MSFASGPSFLGIKFIDLSTTDTVNSGVTETTAITPPEGQIYSLIGLEVAIPDPAGSASGDHTFQLVNSSFSNLSEYLLCVRNSGGAINAQNDAGLVGDTEMPSGIDEQLFAILGERIWCSNSIPLNVVYENDTDVNQTGSRTMKFLFKVYKEVL